MKKIAQERDDTISFLKNVIRMYKCKNYEGLAEIKMEPFDNHHTTGEGKERVYPSEQTVGYDEDQAHQDFPPDFAISIRNRSKKYSILSTMT